MTSAIAPAAPIAAASVDVVMPARITPSVAKVSTVTGTRPTTHSHRMVFIESASSRVAAALAGEENPRGAAPGIELQPRDAEHRPHHHQHHRGRDQDAE